MATKGGGSRRYEPILEAFGERVGEGSWASTSAVALVDDVDAVAAPMATRDGLWLSIETHRHANVGELAHWVLEREVRVQPGAHGDSALHTAVSSIAGRSQTGCLE